MNNVSIITSMYNRKPEVVETIDKLFFPSLLNNADSSTELIIIDDCSLLRKETRLVFEKYRSELNRKFGNVIYFINDNNLGFSESFNRGIFMAGGEKMIVVNDDIYFPHNSLERLAKTLDEPGGYLVAGPITNNNTGTFQYCKQAPILKAYTYAEFEKLEKFAKWLQAKMQGQRVVVDNACGFCFAADAPLLKKMGGFNEKYHYGFYEDNDLMQRIAKEYGEGKIVINSEIFVGHGGVNGFSGTMLQQKLKWNFYLFFNSLKYGHIWGYGKLIERMRVIQQCGKGEGTITELLPEKVDL